MNNVTIMLTRPQARYAASRLYEASGKDMAMSKRWNISDRKAANYAHQAEEVKRIADIITRAIELDG